MKKIPCLFVRDFTNKQRPFLSTTVTPGCEWVLDGEGVATRKWDGTACMIRDGRLYKRYDAKRGKVPPEGFLPAQDADPITGHWPGWLQVDYVEPAPGDVYIALAWYQSGGRDLADGTYEACGSRINGNNERVLGYRLIRHGELKWADVSRGFTGVRGFLQERNVEGIVFWRKADDPECDMAKIRRADFGFSWPIVRL